MVTREKWEEEQVWENDWHGNCVNSINEELKQLVYAKKMGLRLKFNAKTPYNFDLNGHSVLDIGGGAYSLLLKCVNFSKATVVDPCKYPDWIYARYASANIDSIVETGEDFVVTDIYDEVWIYNVLQHTISPQKIIENALKYGRTIRIFEWIEIGISKGHPHNLTEKDLNEWLGGYGKTETLNENGCVGLSYYGIFKGKHYIP